MLTLKTLLIICPLVFLAGFVDAIAGGGGLISLPAYLLAGLPPHQAIATNKMSSPIGTCASTARYLKNGYVVKPVLLPAIGAGLALAALAAWAATALDVEVLRKCFGAFLIAVGAMELFGKARE